MTVKKLLTPENLREYQRLITSHQLDVGRTACFAGMGLGKTAATLTSIDAMQMAGEDSPTLILAPLRVAKTVWGEETQKWDHLKHLKIVPIVGTEKERLQALKYDANIFTTNYENIMWLTEHLGDRWGFKTVIADELSKLKSFRLRQGGQRAAALGKIIHTKVDRFSGLTGSPVANGLKDLWGQMYMVDRGARLGRTFSAYTNRWFKTHPSGYGQIALDHAQDEIQELLRDVCITIDAADYFDIRAPIVTNIEINLPPKVRAMYKEMEDDLFTTLDCGSEVSAFNAAAKSMKLLQICSGAVYVESDVYDDSHKKSRAFKVVHDEKLDALDDILEETGGTPVMIAYNFRSDLERLRKKYPHARWLSDDKEMADFKSGKFQIGLAHPAAVGHGVDSLQNHCYTMVNFSSTWNLEQAEQLLGRIGSIRQIQAGFNRNVFVYNLVAKDTIDEIVMERLVSKSTVQEALLQAMKRRKESN